MTTTTLSKIISREEVLKHVGVSYTCLWLWIKDGKFPAAVALGGNSRRAKIGWFEHEVQAWLNAQQRRLPKGTTAVYSPTREVA